jgi:cyclophilin family peptidyl-prolyl cis-trans isomerase
MARANDPNSANSQFFIMYADDALLNGKYTVAPVGNLCSEILMVQPAQNWHRQRATDSLDARWDRRVLLQR